MEPDPVSTNPQIGNGYATAGFYLAIASILFSIIGLIPIMAIVFSGIGLFRVKERGGKGKTQAWIGLLLGGIQLIVPTALI